MGVLLIQTTLVSLSWAPCRVSIPLQVKLLGTMVKRMLRPWKMPSQGAELLGTDTRILCP